MTLASKVKLYEMALGGREEGRHAVKEFIVAGVLETGVKSL